jgi:1-deoxy-D-xylulose-5-phosphate synthase
MGISRQVLIMGIEDEFTEHGDPGLLMQQYGLTASGIQQRIQAFWPVTQVTSALRRVV